MKTKYSLEQLQAMAKPHFEKYQVDTLYATEDGQFFLKKHFADYHADGAPIHTLKHDAEPAKEPTAKAEKPESIPALTERIAGIEDKAELDMALEKEKNGANRKGAIAAIELRSFMVDLNLVTEKDQLEALLEAEKMGDKRKEAIAAIEDKLSKISA